LAIGRKPEKGYGGSRQWFRTARRVPAAGPYRRRWHGLRYAALSGMDPLQGRALIYLIIMGRLPCPVQRSAWRRYPGIGGGAALDGMPSGATQAAYRRLVWLLYCVRWNRVNKRKSRCKAL